METKLQCQSYTFKDISIILGIGSNAAYSLMNDSKLPSYKIWNRFYIRIADFNDWFSKIRNKNIFCITAILGPS